MDNTIATMFVNYMVYAYIFLILGVIFPFWLFKITVLK